MGLSFIELDIRKVELNNKLVCAFSSNNKIKNILEIGSGNRSTFFMREAIKNKGFGFCLSLENDKSYYKGVNDKLPPDSFGKIEFSPLVYDEKGLHYSFVLKDKYDFIYIDGPGSSLCVDKKDGFLKEASPLLYEFLALSQNWLNSSSGLSMGGGRIFMLDYIKDAMYDDTIIMVDSSARAMVHFFQNYRKEFDFYGFGGLTTQRKVEKMIKPEHLKTFKKMNYWPRKVSIIFNKKSKNAPIIIEDVLKKIVAKNHE